MSGIDRLKLRLGQMGGATPESRFIKDKERTLKKVLNLSYQGETIALADGREFRCLINKDKLKNDYDDKILSIPYKDICLNEPRVGKTTEGEVDIVIKAGDVVRWIETDTYWIVQLEKIEENAYFRSGMRRCRYTVDVNGIEYKVYVKGPVQSTTDWKLSHEMTYNTLNQTAMMTITQDENTLEYFHRHAKLKLNGKNWTVVAVDSMSTDGIIDVYLDEDFSNSVADAIAEEESNKPAPPELPDYMPEIEGDEDVFPYETKVQQAKNIEGGRWEIDNNKVQILEQTDLMVKLKIVTGRSGFFNLSYVKDNGDMVRKRITIMSL